MGAPLIRLDGIGRTYRNGELSTTVLHDVALDIHAGEFVAIMGASGSGKSTLMHLLGCLDKPTTGRYLFEGEDIAGLDSDQLASLRSRTFGFIFQSYHLISSANATENVEVPAIYAGLPREARHARAEELLTGLGLGERLQNRPNQLSGGQQQRVSIARALMNDARILLADEPTGALDSKSGQDVLQLLKDLHARGKTVIVITHDREVASHADRLIEIRDGRIIHDSGHPPTTAESEPAPAPRPAPKQGLAALGDINEAVRMALRALKANLFRTVLTLLGIVIGVASVVVMLAVGNGARQDVVERISDMGTNLLLIRPGAPNTRRSADGTTNTLTPEDAIVAARVDNVVAAVPEADTRATVRAGNTDAQTQVTGTTADYPLAKSWPLAAGVFINDEDNRRYAAVAVIGKTVATNLYGEADPLGQYMLIRNVPFLVIGVMQEKGATPWGQDQDDVVFVPLNTASNRLIGSRHLSSVSVLIDDLRLSDATQEAVRQAVMANHAGVEDFQIRNMASLLENVASTQDTFTMLLGSIAAISLLVGGIGVMNIMLVNVSERTREIGIRMATGARTRNILQQFIVEAMVVSAIGGAIGVVLGLGFASLLQYFGTPIQFTAGPVLLAFGCAFATGLIFGFMPAHKAAHLDPVVALSAD
ncbi:putative ABC transporter ATP-binding protein [Pseudomonas saudimassiliensis]|uniref:Pyoverdine export ATP-binding/permease protein PvdT n=1 Tax=Pseudomonas saudimassiliensis TaxID=1461581 RepID=A0A078MMT1_9PSED|nr:MacB family efflux pump subunit [Pseudomonas saudimassiliensis]CEA06071.1 putative ABC transporter ATP-binding protein [Pseudomonas saudimassiliensis]CEF27496.1 putative ABC transporter ATP-binding protein [Pseudomonas saudimassiliensis]